MTVPLQDDPRQRRFVLANTRLERPPHVPEVQLLLAEDVTTVWQRTEDELGGPGREPPYWASAWAGGQAVARYLLDHPHVVAGRSVLDLASGSGLCAIAAAKAGASSVTASDIDELSVVAIVENAAVNGVAVHAVLQDVLVAEPPAVELVLAGDVSYERGMAERVFRWLRSCRSRGIDVLVGDPGRAFLPRSGLVEVARYEITGDPTLENAGVRHAAVFTLAEPTGG